MLVSLPPELAARVADCRWQKDDLGCSGAHIFRLVRPDGSSWYLKTAVGCPADELQTEAAVMMWLANKLPVPHCLHVDKVGERAFLLMTAVPGTDITHFNDKSDEAKETAVRLLAEGLRLVHSLPMAGCPFDQSVAAKMATARQRMAAGLVDEGDFDTDRTTADIYQELLVTQPDQEDLVFTHGDYCLPNVMVGDGRVTGFIDLGRAGVADRYQDLALCTRSLTHNFGPGWDARFLAHYGLLQADEAKLTFYRLLDEFF